MNMAMTMDGHVYLPGGGWRGLSSESDRRRMDEIRLAHDILLVGHHTMEVDDPVIWVRSPEGGIDPDTPIPVILCGRSLPSRHLKIMEHPPLPVIILADRKLHSMANSVKYSDIEDGMDVVWRYLDESSGPFFLGAAPSDLEPEGILRIFSDFPGEGRILLEGGPTLNGQFFEDDLVDTVYLTVVPFVMGGDSPGFSGQIGAIKGFNDRNWVLENVETSGNEVYLTYMRFR